MSRIDTKPQNSIAKMHVPPNASSSSQASKVPTDAAANRVWEIQTKLAGSKKVRTKKAEKLASITDVKEADLAPLMGKKREELLAGLTRILSSISQVGELEGDSETLQLAKMMVSEHIRRLTLVKGTQVESDGLKGSA